MQRLSYLLLALCWLAACNNSEAPLPDAVTEAPLPPCNFQMQAVQGMPDSKYKVVSGRRTCEADQLMTREILLIAPGEPIDNHKKCNVFATTDTNLVWEVQLSANRLEVLFLRNAPAESTILMQEKIVYDSIEVVYGLMEQPPS